MYFITINSTFRNNLNPMSYFFFVRKLKYVFLQMPSTFTFYAVCSSLRKKRKNLPRALFTYFPNIPVTCERSLIILLGSSRCLVWKWKKFEHKTYKISFAFDKYLYQISRQTFYKAFIAITYRQKERQMQGLKNIDKNKYFSLR